MPMDINNPNAVRAWSMEAETQVIQNSFFFKNNLVKPMKQSDSAVIIKMDELGKKMSGPGAGYDVTFPMIGAAEGYVETGNAPIDGTEVVTKYYNDKHTLNFRRKSFITPGKFSEQLSLRPFREDIMKQAKNFWPVYFDNEIIAKLSGATGSGTFQYFDATIDATVQGRDVRGSMAADGNLLRAPSSGRYVYPAGITAASSLTTAHTMSLDVIDAALIQALTPDKNSTNSRLARPVSIDGDDCAIAVIDYLCLAQMAQATGSRWFIIEQAKTQGGKGSSLTDQMPSLAGVYYSPFGVKVLILPHPRLVRFTTSKNGPDGTAYGVKAIRNLLLFQDAGRMIAGKDTKDMPLFDWYEELRDGGAKLRITTSTTAGIQKTAFSTTETGATVEDFGVVAMDCYANW